MMLKGPSRPITMQMPHEIALAVAADAMAQDVIVHATADVDGINLHKAQMIERRADIRKTGIKAGGLPHEAACSIEAERE